MKLCLVTTTINVPKLLATYRKFNKDVFFIIVGDRKTPDLAVTDFLQGIPNHLYLGADHQLTLGFKIAEYLPFNSIGRRSVGFLSALQTDAEVVITIDDDNMAVDPNYFDHFWAAFHTSYAGISVQAHHGWFDPGRLLIPQTPHRGYPTDHQRSFECKPIVDAKVGAAAGLILGDPDIDATTRIVNAPDIHQASELARAGVVVNPSTWTVFNSQNTAVLRKFLPCMLLWPGVGRHDDIFASMVTQRVMRDFGYVVHFGQPFVYQQRNQHNLLVDLKQEIYGMENIIRFSHFLEDIELRGETVIEKLRTMYEHVETETWLPPRTSHLGMVWLEDCERVMG